MEDFVNATTGSFKTRDGVSLQYVQAGPGDADGNIILMPGMRQTAAQWQKQVRHFSKSYRVTSYDHRSHGESSKTPHGHRIASYAADFLSLLLDRDLSGVNVVAHSMSCSVVWCFWDLYPEHHHRIAKLVLVDQTPHMVRNPAWTPEQAATYGAILETNTPYDFANDIDNMGMALLKGFFTPDVSAEDLAWAAEQNMKMDAPAAAALFLNHTQGDWRDVLPRLNVPTLVIGTEGSPMPESALRWVSEQIPGAEYVVFTKEEQGCHMMFWSNPEKFNRVVDEFVSKQK
jgi:non-heme chloroperoxidase